MRLPFARLALTLATAVSLHAAPPPPPAATPPNPPTPAGGRVPLTMIGDDDAAQGEYGGGWGTGKNGGQGFGPWTLREATAGADGAGGGTGNGFGNNNNGNGGTGGEKSSHAGFYLAATDSNPGLKPALATRGKAFGLYANGSGFELATAFRPFAKGLKPGQSFSWLMQHGEIRSKSDQDAPGAGSVGVTLRAGNACDKPEDYNADSRFEFGFYKDSGAYAIYDGDGMRRLDTVPFTDAGLAVTVTLTGADTYDLEVTTLSPRKTLKLAGRKLSGTAGAVIQSFAVFDRNGEANDLWVNGFQVLQP